MGGGVVAPAPRTLTISDNGEPSLAVGAHWRGPRWIGYGWDVTTGSLVGKRGSQPFTVDSPRSSNWRNLRSYACVTRSVIQGTIQPNRLQATEKVPDSCTQIASGSKPTSISLTQSMIDNDGVVFLVVLYQSTTGSSVYGKFEYSEWVRVVPAPRARLSLSPGSVPETGGRSTVTAILDRTASAAATITVAAAAVPPAVGGDFTQSGTKLTIAAGATTSTGTVTLTAVDDPGEHVGQEGVGVGDGGGRRRAVAAVGDADHRQPDGARGGSAVGVAVAVHGVGVGVGRRGDGDRVAGQGGGGRR